MGAGETIVAVVIIICITITILYYMAGKFGAIEEESKDDKKKGTQQSTNRK